MTVAARIHAVLASTDDPLETALRQHFAHPGFRPAQRPTVEAVMAGRDTLAVMPTGSGKSICYQLPALFDAAPTVVVSPLIALMKDQVDGLHALGIPAAAMHSNMTAAEQRQATSAYLSSSLRLLYVAPERLIREDMRTLLRARPPARIVVDEAHCISEWGHDFRRDYLRIGEVLQELSPMQVVACTATATPDVRTDIAERLEMREPAVFVHGFARDNLTFEVQRCASEAAKLARLDELIDPSDGHAVVYAGTRARASALAARLSGRFSTMLYHGDLDADERAGAQERFASGQVRVAVTTSAFGMGIDVATVRQVLHVALPGSLEEYYQQAGRAGRDGRPARCVLLFGPNDNRLQQFFIDAAHPTPSTLGVVYQTLRDHGRDPGDWRLLTPANHVAAQLSTAAGNAARAILREAGVINRAGEVAQYSIDRLPVDHGRITRHRRLAYRRFEQLQAYATRRRCRHRMVLEYFEDPDARDCGTRCDVCCAGAQPAGTLLDAGTVQRALSAAARLNGRIGLTKLAGVLVGSRSRGVAEIAGATSIPTYGALSQWREQDVLEVLRRLIEAGALEQTAPPYPSVVLTRAGIAALRGEATVAIVDPRSPVTAHAARAPAPADGAELDAAGRELLPGLRAWRSAMARGRGVPAYVVLHDRTLRALAAARPGDAASLLAVDGIGPGKMALYGDALLALCTGADAAP